MAAPTILLPEGFASWSPSKREAVLAHELAHVERRDALFVALGAINQCLYWFHPLAWLVPKRLAALAERACDERAVALTGEPIRYARHLLEFAAAMVDRRDRVVLGGLSMADGGDLGTRMEAILDRNRAGSAPLSRQGRLLLITAALLVVLAVAAIRVGPRALAEAVTAATEGPSVTVHGEVLDPDGRPMAGARLFVPYHTKAGYRALEKTATGPDGQFRFTIAESEFRDCSYPNPLAVMSVAAAADGLGLAWLEPPVVSKGGELTLRLVRDEPIRGRVVDLQGKPVAGARIRVYDLASYPGEDLGPFIDAAHNGRNLGAPRQMWGGPVPGQPREITTDADGRFRLAGIGRERVARLAIDGQSVATNIFSAVTRDAKAVGAPLRDAHNGDRIQPAAFDLVAQPSRTIRGIIRDRQTGKPVAGVEIQGPWLAKATTDAAGRFELGGFAKSQQYNFHVVPPPGEPFLAFHFNLEDTPGFEPITAEIPLTRGIPIHGRVIDDDTHQPVKGHVEYHPLYPNPNLTTFGSKPVRPHSQMPVRADGTFSLAALPGPGVVVFQAYGADYYQKYRPARVDRDELNKLVKGTPDMGKRYLNTAAGGGAMSALIVDSYNALALVNPGADARTLTVDLSPGTGRTIEGTVVGPDGQPLTGVSVYGLTTHQFHRDTLDTPRFQVRSLDPRQQRALVFYHKENGLGLYKEIRGDERGPLTIRLERCGGAMGRLLDEDGEPVSGLILHCDRENLVRLGPQRTDRPRWPIPDRPVGARPALPPPVFPDETLALRDAPGRAGPGPRPRRRPDRPRPGGCRQLSRANMWPRSSHTSDATTAWAPYEPGDRAPWNLRRVVHLHRRAGFAATWDEIRRELADGPGPSIDRLLVGRSRGRHIPEDFDSTAAMLADAAVDASGGRDDPRRLKAWWLYRMIFGPDPEGHALVVIELNGGNDGSTRSSPSGTKAMPGIARHCAGPRTGC